MRGRDYSKLHGSMAVELRFTHAPALDKQLGVMVTHGAQVTDNKLGTDILS